MNTSSITVAVIAVVSLVVLWLLRNHPFFLFSILFWVAVSAITLLGIAFVFSLVTRFFNATFDLYKTSVNFVSRPFRSTRRFIAERPFVAVGAVALATATTTAATIGGLNSSLSSSYGARLFAFPVALLGGKDKYLAEVERCTQEFVNDRPTEGKSSRYPIVSVSYSEAPMSFNVAFEGRSPQFALKDRGFREKLRLNLVVSREFDPPHNPQVDVEIVSARYFKWPDDSPADDRQFTAFGPDNQAVLVEFRADPDIL